MGRLTTFIFGFVVGGICVFGGQKYHVVVADDGTYLVPKMEASFADAYVDVREFTAGDWREHPSLAAAIVRDGQSHIMQGAVVGTLGNGAEQFLQALRKE